MSSENNCNSKHFSWLMKSCFPNNPNHHHHHYDPQPLTTAPTTTISSLPDDLILECLSRAASSSLPSLSAASRRFSLLLNSAAFSHLRRRYGLLRHSIFSVSASDSSLFTASFRIDDGDRCTGESWKMNAAFDLGCLRGSFSHARVVAIGHAIYVLGRDVLIRFDAWTGRFCPRSAMSFRRKKFAASVVNGKIYVAGGVAKTSAVEEYDPNTDEWRVVSNAPRRRYGCVGASVDGIFYVIGGLKIGSDPSLADRSEAHVYASSMDLYDVEARHWLRSRSVPGGGCVVAGCAAGGFVYVLSSHAVELSFWRFNARKKAAAAAAARGFGEWCRIRSPPLPAQVILDSTVRFSCVGVGEKVVLIQVTGCIDDLLRRIGNNVRGFREGLVMVYDSVAEDWSRAADLPEVVQRAACVCVEC